MEHLEKAYIRDTIPINEYVFIYMYIYAHVCTLTNELIGKKKTTHPTNFYTDMLQLAKN